MDDILQIARAAMEPVSATPTDVRAVLLELAELTVERAFALFDEAQEMNKLAARLTQAADTL